MLGTTLNHRYRLEQLLGRATSGPLYLATDEQTGEMLAVKVFSDAGPPHGEGWLRYRLAMSRLEGLEHPHLLLPLLTARAEGRTFQVLPYYPARSLEEELQGPPLTLAEGVAVLRQAATGLAALHRAGVAHLNLKPGNLLISREEDSLHAVLADPARCWLTGPPLAPGEMDAAAYRAPEQAPWLDGNPQRRADLYALGMLGYRMLTGRLPFFAATPAQMFAQHLATPPVPPREHNPHIPPRLAATLLRLLAKQPRERHPSAEALLADLEDWDLPGTPPPAPRGGGDPFAEDAPLQGRDAARESVLTALARTASGSGSMVMLCGEPGMGKGDLVRELRLACEAAGALVLRAEAPEQEWCAPFLLPLELLSALLLRWESLPDLHRRDLLYRLHERLGENAPILTGLLPELRTLLAAEGGPVPLPLGRERLRGLHVLCEALRALAEPRHPLVLWLRGLQHADPDSLEWLGHLAHRLPETPVLIVAETTPGAEAVEGTLRPWLEGIGRGDALQWLELPPLTEEQCAADLAWRLGGETAGGPLSEGGGADRRAVAGEGLPVRLARWMMERWGGRPLAHRWALRVLAARRVLRRDAPDAPWQCDWSALERASWPESLPALLHHRLELLPDELLQVLQAAVVLPGTFTFETLSALLEHLPPHLLLERLEAVVGEGLLRREGDVLRFSHPLLREALARQTPPARLGELHQLVGALREAHPRDPPLLHHHQTAWHFHRGGEQPRFLEHGLQALAAAWRHLALRGLCHWAGVLQPLLRADPRLAKLLIGSGIAHGHLGRPALALSLLASARTLGLAPETEMEVIAQAAWVHQQAGEREAAIVLVEEGLALAGETLPQHPVGTALARLTGNALRHYETLLHTAGGNDLPPISEGEGRLADLLALASALFASAQPNRAVLADEKIVRLAGARLPSSHLVYALVRLGEAEGDPEGDSFTQARRLLDRHAFPHVEAEYCAARGRCWIGRGSLRQARRQLEQAHAGFRRAGDLQGEGEVLQALIELERQQGAGTALAARVAELNRVAALLGSAHLTAWAAGLAAYAAGLAGRTDPAVAADALRRQALRLGALQEGGDARYLLALAGELALGAAQLGEAMEVLRCEGTLPDTADAGELLMEAVRAETHLIRSATLPEERGFHLEQARALLKRLRAAREELPRLMAEVARLEAMEGFLLGDAQGVLGRVEAVLDELGGMGARLPVGRLLFRVAEGLKALGDPAWVRWGGRALETFEACGAGAYLAATRMLLELAAPEPDASAGEKLRPAAPGPSSGGAFPLLLERLARQGVLPEPELQTDLLEHLMAELDARYGALFLPNRDGQLVLSVQSPLPPVPGEYFNRWLAETVWRDGRGQALESYQPPLDTPGAGGESAGAQSLLCVPLAVGGERRGAVMLGSAVSRLVLEAGQLGRLSALAAEAGVVLALNRTLHAHAETRAGLLDEVSRQNRWLAWAPGATAGETQAELLRHYFTEVAAPLGYRAALLCQRDPEDGRLDFGAWHDDGRNTPAWDELLPIAPAGTQAEAALLRQAPLSLKALDAPPPSGEEQTLLNGVGAREGVWLPLVRRGKGFGAVLLVAATEASVDPRVLEGHLLVPLRLLAPALYQAQRAERLARHATVSEERERTLFRTHRLYRRLTPPGFGEGAEELEQTVREGREQTQPVLAGEVPGLTQALSQGKAPLLEALGSYYDRVQQALALHQGTLERILHRQWIATYPPHGDGALWGAQTLYQMLLGLREEAGEAGAMLPPTGLGLHVGNVLRGALPAGDRLAPFLVGGGVRTASRLAAMSIAFRCGILVSHDTVEALEAPEHFDLRHLGKLRPAPGEGRIDVYELFSVRDEAVRAPMQHLQGVWQEALREYQLGRWKQAAGAFGEYIARLPQDRPARFFLRQCRQRYRG